MALPVCSLCGKKPRGRMANFYWAQFDGGNAREAWKQRFCRPCFDEHIEPWYEKMLTSHAGEGPYSCVECDESDPNHLVALFLTSYLPNAPMEREGIDVCINHAKTFLALVRQGADMLVDRPREQAAPAGARW